MDEPIFLTTNQAAALLNVAKSAMLDLFRKRHLSPVDFGRGRGRGLRWNRAEVIKIADALHAEAQEQTARQAKPKKKTPTRVVGRSIDALFSELSSPVQ